MEHRGRRLKALFKGVGKDNGEHEVKSEFQPVMQSIPPRQQTSSAALHHETTTTRQSISDEFRRPRGASSSEGNSKHLSNTANAAPITSLNSTGSDLSNNLKHLTLGGEEELPSHVKFSEEVADRNLVQHSDLRHQSDVAPSSAKSQTWLQTGQEEDDSSVTGSNPSTSERYDRKFSESTRANKANDVYVRAGRKPTGHVSRSGGPIYVSDEEDDEADDDIPRELRRKPVESSSPAPETLRATDYPVSSNNSTSRHDGSLPPATSKMMDTTRGVDSLSSSSSSSFSAISQTASPATHRSHHASGIPAPLHGASFNERGIDSNSPASQRLGEGDQSYQIRDSQQPVDLASVVDLSNTSDTDKTTHYAPAVTHETIHPEIYNIREEEITREIHTHDVYNRIQPIMETEILPARHFIYHDGEKVEVKASDIPGRTMNKPDWAIIKDLTPTPPKTPVPKNWQYPFTARFWTGTEGDATNAVGDDGIRRTETTWVHPPTVGHDGPLSTRNEAMHSGGSGVLAEDSNYHMPGSYSDYSEA